MRRNIVGCEKEKKQAVQLSVTYPHHIEDSYAIRRVAHKIKGGAKLIATRSAHLQGDAGVLEITSRLRHLLDYMMIADAAEVPHANYCVPRVEVELRSSRETPEGPRIGLTTCCTRPNTDTRDGDRRCAHRESRKIFDTVADNARRGHRSSAAADRPMEMDLRWPAASCTATPRSRRRASPRACSAIRRSRGLARQPAGGKTRDARSGHLILAGSFTSCRFREQGDTLHGDFGPWAGSQCSSLRNRS